MHKALVALLGVVLLTFAFVVKAGAQPLPDIADEGFSHYIQHYVMGSKTVLIFETHSGFGKERFGVAPDFVEDNVEILNKFLKWAAMARERGDVLNKEIGMAKAFDFGMYFYWNKYDFVTGNDSKDYYLKVVSGTKLLGLNFNPQNPDEPSSISNRDRIRVMSFNEDQVRQIIQRMQDLKSGQMKTRAETANDYK